MHCTNVWKSYLKNICDVKSFFIDKSPTTSSFLVDYYKGCPLYVPIKVRLKMYCLYLSVFVLTMINSLVNTEERYRNLNQLASVPTIPWFIW